MGMFDDVVCEAPLPDGFVSKNGFQTKSFDSLMDTYTITKDGRLLRASGWYLRRDEAVVELDDYHGDFYFYTYSDEDKELHEYVARFTHGKLERITKNENPR